MRLLGGALPVLLVWSVFLAGVHVATSEPATAVASPVRILIVGDSVTQGSAGDYTWRYRLWQHFADSGTEVDFVGPREDVFDNIADRHGSMDYVDPPFDRDHAARWGQMLEVQDVPIADLVATYHPDVVVEMLGINDLIWAGASPQAVEERLRTFAADARAARADVGLVLVRLPQTWVRGASATNDLIDQVARDFDGPTAAATSAVADQGFQERRHTWDPAHPNAAGELIIASAVADAFAAQGIGPAYSRPLSTVPNGPRLAPGLEVVGGDGTVRLRWTGSPGSDHEYVWRRDVTAGEDWAQLPEPRSGATWTDAEVTNGHVYEYRLQPVKGYHAAEPDVRSNLARVTPQAPAAFRPDAMVRTSGASWTGNDVYGSYRRQRISQTLGKAGVVRTSVVRLQNEANRAERLLVSGTPGGDRFRVRYLAGGEDVTRKVVAGTLRTAVLAPGRYLDLKVRVTRTGAAGPGDSRTLKVLASSAHDDSRRDAVATVVRATR